VADEEKPFDPTPSRLQKARREGNVARSTEINGAAAFAAASLTLFAVLPYLGAIQRDWAERVATGQSPPGESQALALAVAGALPLLAALLAGTTASILQSRGLLFVAPSVKFERLNPAQNIKRMFSLQSLVSAAKASLAFVAALWAAIPTAELVFTRGTGGGTVTVFGALAALGVERVFASALLVAAVFAVADYLIVRKEWLKKLRMSLYELKKELQENEGDPHLRGRRRQRHWQMTSGSVDSVKKASFVVANPTHIAVALRYEPPEIAVPLVVVMGAQANALRIRALAAEAGVPVVENVELARMLWATASAGRAIPRESFVAVAEIVTALHRSWRRAS
jgi:flagellar biosynthesis protein FlhB